MGGAYLLIGGRDYFLKGMNKNTPKDFTTSPKMSPKTNRPTTSLSKSIKDHFKDTSKHPSKTPPNTPLTLPKTTRQRHPGIPKHDHQHRQTHTQNTPKSTQTSPRTHSYTAPSQTYSQRHSLKPPNTNEKHLTKGISGRTNRIRMSAPCCSSMPVVRDSLRSQNSHNLWSGPAALDRE